MIELDNTMLLFIGSENYSGTKISYVNDLSMSVNCLLWRDGGIGRHITLKP